VNIALADLKRICPLSRVERMAPFVEPLNAAMTEFDITTPARQAMFLAQLAHESGGFRYVREIASGEAYEDRADLGNDYPGDGVKFKGRGLIQITGRTNYSACGAALGLDLLSQPELLEPPANAARSAGWFWYSRGLNALADVDDFKRITKRINGGLNGYEERLAYYNRARKVMA